MNATATSPAQPTYEARKSEALFRLAGIEINEDTIRRFEDGRLTRYESPSGTPHHLDDSELLRIRDFEKQFNALVYLIARFHLKTANSPIDAYFYVSDNKANWRKDGGLCIAQKSPVFFDHLNDSSLSDFGWLGYSLTPAKGLTAVYVTCKGQVTFV